MAGTHSPDDQSRARAERLKSAVSSADPNRSANEEIKPHEDGRKNRKILRKCRSLRREGRNKEKGRGVKRLERSERALRSVMSGWGQKVRN